MKIDLLALDLDGTTLRSDNTLAHEVKAAIERAIENGIEVVVASGRPYVSMPREILEISGLRYVIASNGAAVYENGRRIISDTLQEEDVLKILELTADYDLIWEAFIEGETCTDKRYYDDPVKYGCGEAYIDYVRNSRGFSDDMRDYILKNRHRLDSIEFVCKDKALRESIWKMLADELGESVYITSSSANYVEFMNGTATKGNAVKKLCEILGIDIKNTAAAGNADNDADMIAQAGLGAAVRNASAKCLESADVIMPSNDNNGISFLLNRVLKDVV